MTDKHRPLDPSQHPFATFALSGELAESLRRDPAYANGKNARALVRSTDLTVVLTALQKGEELKPHHAPGPATAVVLEGEICFRTLGESPSETLLGQHDCAVFSAQVEHAVEARTAALLLIVIGHKA
jgi:quercetin dioxygenase-like cupin family protein